MSAKDNAIGLEILLISKIAYLLTTSVHLVPLHDYSPGYPLLLPSVMTSPRVSGILEVYTATPPWAARRLNRGATTPTREGSAQHEPDDTRYDRPIRYHIFDRDGDRQRGARGDRHPQVVAVRA